MEKYLLKKERAFANQIFREFTKLKKLIQKTLIRYDRQKDFTDDINKIINDFNITLAVIISKRAKEIIKKANYEQSKLFGIDFKIDFNLENEGATQYLDDLVRIHSNNIRYGSIGSTTYTRITKLIRDGVAESLSYTQIAEQITEIDGLVFSKGRAENIAVTEIRRANEYGKFRTMEEVDGVVLKQWQSREDSRVRPTHRQNQNDGYIGMNEVFSGTNTKMPPEGGRCRCSLIYKVL